MRTELWNGHPVRFVERDGEWWAVAKDVCDALEIEDAGRAVQQAEARLKEAEVCDPISKRITLPAKSDSPKSRKTQEMACVNELGLYELIFASRKKEAVQFRHWVAKLLRSLREAFGFEQYRAMAFIESAKNHHLDMNVIKEAFNPQDRVPYIKAQSITNKCMANILGEPKTIGKDELKARYPEMLPLRDEILTETAKLMAMSEKYGLGLSVSKAIYGKFGTAA